jgi:hypothetical protein
MAHQRSGDILIEVRLLQRSGLDLLTLSSSHCDPTRTFGLSDLSYLLVQERL